MNKLYVINWMWDEYCIKTQTFWSASELDAKLMSAKAHGWTFTLKEANDCHMVYEAY